MRILTPYQKNHNLASDLFDEMEHLFERWDRTPSMQIYDERNFAPACDISEADNHYLMSVDLPGMKKEDIKIEVSGEVLTVSGERKREVPEKNHRTQRYERSYGFFKRSFTLPASIDADKVEARYENGVLELYLPKCQTARPHRIEIQTGQSGIFGKLLGSKKNTQEIKDLN
jgi:HSP20 family protein